MFGIESPVYQGFYKFVESLDDVVGDKNKPVRLYSHLLSKITSQHGGAIERNCLLLGEFIDANESAINSQDHTLFADPTIRYSDKVFIDLGTVMGEADQDTRTQIWKHILSLKKKLGKDEQKTSEQLNALCKMDSSTISEGMGNLMEGEGIEQISQMLKSFGGEKLAKSVTDIMNSDNFKNLLGEVKTKMDDGEIDLGNIQNMMMDNKMTQNLFTQMQGGGGFPGM